MNLLLIQILLARELQHVSTCNMYNVHIRVHCVVFYMFLYMQNVSISFHIQVLFPSVFSLASGLPRQVIKPGASKLVECALPGRHWWTHHDFGPGTMVFCAFRMLLARKCGRILMNFECFWFIWPFILRSTLCSWVEHKKLIRQSAGCMRVDLGNRFKHPKRLVFLA